MRVAGAGRFKRLPGTGTVYTNTNYQHANPETIVGHTTLSTRASLAVHGMIGRTWFDSEDFQNIAPQIVVDEGR